MTVTTENSIQALLSSSEEMMLGELSLIKHTLEKLFESDEAQIPKEELSNDLFKIVDVLERIIETKSTLEKFKIYYNEYQPILSDFKVKYSDFLATDKFIFFEATEKIMDVWRELFIALDVISSAHEEEDKERQYESLYTGIAKLSELLEQYILYFPQDLIDAVKNIALAFLKDPKLKPDLTNQNQSVFSCLIGLKNTAKAVLWEIAENRTKNEKSHLSDSPSNINFTREMQIQKNQTAMDWAKSRLEKIESIAKEKGWSL